MDLDTFRGLLDAAMATYVTGYAANPYRTQLLDQMLKGLAKGIIDELVLEGAPPGAHAAQHVTTTDPIQLATSTQKGLMSSTYAAKLDGIGAGANVSAGAVFADNAVLVGDGAAKAAKKSTWTVDPVTGALACTVALATVDGRDVSADGTALDTLLDVVGDVTRVTDATYTVLPDDHVIEVDRAGAGPCTITLDAANAHKTHELVIVARDNAIRANPIKVVCAGGAFMDEGVRTFYYIRKAGATLRLHPDATDNRYHRISPLSDLVPVQGRMGAILPCASATLPAKEGAFYLNTIVADAAALAAVDAYGRPYGWSTSAVADNYASIITAAIGQWVTGGRAVLRLQVSDVADIVAGLWVGNVTAAAMFGATDTPGARAYAAITFSTRRGDTKWTSVIDDGTNNPGTPTNADTGIAPVAGIPDELVIEWFSGRAVLELYDETNTLVYQRDASADYPADATSTVVLFGIKTLSDAVRTIFDYRAEVWLDQ
jgi:hypothetical protein